MRAARLELAQLLTQTGRPEQARPMLEQLVSETPERRRDARSAVPRSGRAQGFAAAARDRREFEKVRPDLPLGWYLAGALLESQHKLG